MNRRNPIIITSGLCGLIALGGCNGLGEIALNVLDTRNTTVVLTNTSDQFDVEADILYDDQQETVSALLREFGQKLVLTIPAGESVTFTRDCDDLQAIMIDDADLLILGGAGPDDDTGVLRDGDDFGCGDTIVFTFTHSDLILDFQVQTAIQ
jgi:hypothetical protein